MGDLIAGTRVIGMWYWELEEFPSLHHVGLQHVDEVWAATDFMRDAIARHSGSTPVRTVTPPLPQAGPHPGPLPALRHTSRPAVVPVHLRLPQPGRPEEPIRVGGCLHRGLRRQASGDRPLLVIKTINADKQTAACGAAEDPGTRTAGRDPSRDLPRPRSASRAGRELHVLRLVAPGRRSGPHSRRGHGLGQAGDRDRLRRRHAVLQRTQLVPGGWTPGYVAETAGPYKKGLAWAEPDLDQAAVTCERSLTSPSSGGPAARSGRATSAICTPRGRRCAHASGSREGNHRGAAPASTADEPRRGRAAGRRRAASAVGGGARRKVVG